MKVTLFGAFPDLYRQSMAVYAGRLTQALERALDSGETVAGFLPDRVRLAPRPLRYWSQYVRYQRAARRAQGDVSHVVDHAYGHLVHALDPARTVVTFHDAMGLERPGGRALGGLGRRVVTRWTLSGLAKAARIICVSQASRTRLSARLDFPPDRIAMVPQGVDERFFAEPAGDPRQRFGLGGGLYILHVGHSRPYKNVPALLHVLAILHRSLGMDVRLLKAGEALTAEQWRLARELGVARRIVQLGFVPDADLPWLYRCADALLFPSLDEGFGLPILEAMASGLPVVASDRGSLPEVVGAAGLLADPDDHETLAKHMAAVLEDQSLSAALRAAGLERARLFSWKRTAERTLEVYRHVHRSAT